MLVESQSGLHHRNLAVVALLKQGDDVVEVALAENLLTLFVDVERQKHQFLMDGAVFQVEDIGEGVDGDAERVAADGVVEERVVAIDFLSLEGGCRFSQIFCERLRG